MKREWNADGLAEHWSLRPEEKALLGNRNPRRRRGTSDSASHLPVM